MEDAVRSKIWKAVRLNRNMATETQRHRDGGTEERRDGEKERWRDRSAAFSLRLSIVGGLWLCGLFNSDMTGSAKPPPGIKQPPITRERLADAYAKARAHLLSQRTPEGFWAGELASSALSTATAVCALTLADRHRFAALIVGGARWLLDHPMSDGGWGGTVKKF